MSNSSMVLIALILTVLVFQVICVQSLNIGRNKVSNPGFRTTITNKGLDYVMKVGLPILESKLSSIKFPDLSGSTHVKVVGKVEYQLSDIHLSGLTFGKTSLVSKPGTGLTLSASDISFHGSAHWHYKVKILFPIKDSGSVDMSASGISLTVGVVVGADAKGHATLSTKTCSFNVGHLKVKFHGGASWLYNLFDSNIAGAIKSSLNKEICKAASDEINTAGNKALESLPVLVKLDKVSAIDYSLLKPPNFTAWYIETDHKGEFFPVSNTSKEAPFSPPILPPLSSHSNATSARMLYLWLTDYVANTASLVYQESGMLTYTITPNMIPSNPFFELNTKSVALLLNVPELYSKCPDMDIEIVVNATKPPVVEIVPSGANFTAPAATYFYVLTKNGSQTSPVFVFSIGVVAVLDTKAWLIEVGGKQMIRANATYLSATFGPVNSRVGDIDVKQFQTLFNSLANSVITKKVNEYFNKGLSLPIVDGVAFVNSNIIFGKGYVLVATNIDYEPTSIKHLNEA